MEEDQNVNEVVVRLPQSGQAFFAELKEKGCIPKFAAGTLDRKEKLPAEIQQILHYSYPGLTHGRPLNKVMVILVGQSGAGKSTTINALFNDHICETSDCKSQTRSVTEYGKELCVKDPTLPSVIGTLSFVDPPGVLDVDQTKEAANLAITAKFRDETPDLIPRKGILKTSATIREQVYPNLVLMTVPATDNRMRGPDSKLRKCIKALEKYRFIDRLYPNLMVVVTHAMSLPRKNYTQETKKITVIIQDAVLSILRLRNVQVVFVENMPDNFDLQKPAGCDFYELPDGQLSHYNLIKAMEKQFDTCGDILGKLLCGWYFSDDCPEKQVKARVLNSIEHSKLTNEETEEALKMLTGIDVQLRTYDDEKPPKFKFQFLGHGYCLKSESPKLITICNEKETVNTKILNTLYTVPKCIELKGDDEEQFLQVCFETKEAYQSKRADMYGLSKDVKLIVHVESNGRWVKDGSNQTDSIIRTIFEKQLVLARIEKPERNVKKDLVEILHDLPEIYDERTKDRFHEFFRTCGTHFVHEVGIGGYVIIDNPVKTATHTEAQGLEIFSKVEEGFKSLISQERGERAYGDFSTQSYDKEIQRCTLVAEGGDPPQIRLLTELTAARYTDWFETVKRYPVELQYSLKLSPYSVLVKDAGKKFALAKATKDYLEDKEPPAPAPASTAGKYINLLQLAEELILHHEVGHISPSEIKRNAVSSEMVKQAQFQARKHHKRCTIL